MTGNVTLSGFVSFVHEDRDGRDGRVTMESAARGNISAERKGVREQTVGEEAAAGDKWSRWREDMSLGGATAGWEDVLPATFGSRH